MEEVCRWHHVRVIANLGATVAVAPEPISKGAAIGWGPSSVPTKLLPAGLQAANSVFWVASSQDREVIAVSIEMPG